SDVPLLCLVYVFVVFSFFFFFQAEDGIRDFHVTGVQTCALPILQYVMNPVDTMVNTARGISDRVAMREFIEVSKTRFLQQFGHMLPKNRFGQVMWPSKVEHIGRPGELASKELADARTTWEAINYWENGYINAIDDRWKAS